MPSGHQYKNIAGNATTVVKSGPCLLHSVTVNKAGTATTLQIFDNTAGSGTLIATINTAGAIGTLTYDVWCTIGLTVVGSGTTAPDVTITYL